MLLSPLGSCKAEYLVSILLKWVWAKDTKLKDGSMVDELLNGYSRYLKLSLLLMYLTCSLALAKALIWKRRPPYVFFNCY